MTRASVFAALLSVAAAAIVSSAAPAAASDQRASEQRIAALVRDLGSDKFATREKATRELIELGIVTREALERAVDDPDAEVRVRARAVLEIVCDADFQRRLDAFSADYDGSRHRTLPAWDRFSHEFGGSRLARELFVEMQRAEPDLLAAVASGTKPASETLAERARDILEGHDEVQLSLGTLASFLFVGSAEGVKVEEQGAAQLFPYIVQLTYQRNGKSAYWPVVLKKLVGGWLAKDTSPSNANQNLILAAHLELRTEALAVAERILTGDDKQFMSRMMGILVMGRYGGKPQVAVIEKLLEDATPCQARPENIPASAQIQMRDVALAVLLQITGQDLEKYGTLSPQPYTAMGFQAPTFLFEDDQARQAALAKWAAWRAEHPDS